MKKLNKVIISLALVLILALPMFVGGCFGGSDPQEGIKIHTSFKTEYNIGDELDVTDGKIEYTDKDGKKSVIEITTQMVTSFNTLTEGTRNLIVTYQGNTVLVSYTVYEVVDVELDTMYYCHPSINTDPAVQGNMYDYIKITAQKVYAISSSTAPNDIDDNAFREEFSYSYTKTIVNHKAVYTVSITNGTTVVGSMVITALTDNTISVVMNAGTEQRTGVFTKKAA